jgi:hypothetical protein
MYAPVDFSLPLSIGLVCFLLLERIIGSIIGLFWSDESDLKQAMSQQFISSFTEAVANFFFSVCYTVFSLASVLISAMLWVSIILLLGSVMYVTYEQAPWVWTDLARAYNAFLGPFIHTTVVGTVGLFNTVFKGIIPLWNGVFFFISRLISGFFLPTMIQESLTLGRAGLAVYSFSKHASLSLFAWVQQAVVSCPVSDGDSCFELIDRTLDIVTPMADIRDIVGYFVMIIRNICDPITPIFDIITFPLMDLNLAKGVHNIVNAVLYVVVQMPEITYLRCNRHGGEMILMCTPDMDPFFSFLVTGIRDVGRMVDNWIEVVFVIIQGILGFTSTACDGITLIPSVLPAGPLRFALFGSNQTVVIGLGGWLMAITDGMSVAYHGQGNMRMTVWPSPVNISHGVAAVTYSSSSDRDVTRLSASARASTATALMGCRCMSDGQRIQLQCTVLPYEGLLANQSHLIPVFFQQGDTIERSLRCSDIDIIVQSVRWPATRFSSSSTPLPECSLTRTCNQIDATVWVIPRGNCDRESTVCNCFPFCMATRLSGSQTSPLVLYSADQWRSKVYIVRRDCNLRSSSSDMHAGLSVSDSVADSPVVTIQASTGEAPQFIASPNDQTLSCTDNLLVTSIINRTQHPAYTNPTAAFLRNPLAPFVVTGDTILTSIRHGDGGYTVQVERLTGSTGSEFTLTLVTGKFPSYPPVRVPSDLFMTYPKDHITTPYARQATLAVSSRSFVFYAVNPSMHVYDAYLTYCRGGVDLPQFGLIMTSSFSPIRIWRVDVYRRCGAGGCGTDLVKQADIPDAFSEGEDDGHSLTWDCVKTYNEGITQMEYINEANIAVTVRHTSVNGSIVEYKIYWLHVTTMRISETPWQDEVYQTSTALSAFTLCPSMQVMPEIGSLFAELLNAVIFLVKMPIDIVAYLPGITNLWASGTICPLQTRGHSILQQCGSNAFLLDDFFDSLQTATNIFWSSLTLISAAVDDVTADTDASRLIQNSLDGLARYGAGSIDLWTARFQVMNVMAAGPAATIRSMPTTVLIGSNDAVNWVQGGYKLAANTLGWARFGYTCIAKMVVTITQNVLLNQQVGVERSWRIIVNTLDEMSDVYDGTVVENLRQSCAGISLMMGLTNPWAVFIYQQCIAANTVVSAGLDLFLSIFNLAPFAQCMCSGTAGKVFGDYAMSNCVPQASTRLRPTLIYMIQSARFMPSGDGSTPASTLCKKMLAYTKSEIVGSVQPWFDAQFASMNALAASLDYALSWFDSKAGQCLNYNEDPDVVVIMPFPSDYFQACGSTSLCRSKCSGVWNAFDNSLAASAVKSTSQQVNVAVESLFFPVLTIDAFNPMKIKALIQPSSPLCALVCGGDTKPGDTCLAVAGIKTGALFVQYYCVPIMMTSSVRRTLDLSLEWGVEYTVNGVEHWAEDILKVQFGDSDGRTLVSLTSTGNVILSSASGSVEVGSKIALSKAFGLQVVAVTDMMVMYRAPYASIHLSILYRKSDGHITAKSLHGKVVLDINSLPDIPEPTWLNMGSSFFSSIQGYSASRDATTTFYPSATFILLPHTDGLPMNVLTVQWDGLDPSNGVVSWSSYSIPDTPQGVGKLLADGKVLSQNCIVDSEGAYIAFMGAPPYQSTGWISQARITGAVAEEFDSQTTTFSVNTKRQCSVKSCAGCPDGEVQRLCDAVQRCAVINCIGTPVNMRRVLCQLGEKIADESRANLALMHGGWSIFVDMFMVTMDLSFQKGVTGVSLEWPDDRFFGYICTVKDQGAHYISIFTSAINGVLQVGHSAVTYFQGGAHTIDSNFHAMTTMPMTALTSFLHQIWLSPVYALIVSQKVMMCRVQGVMAIFDSSGFRVTIGNAEMQAASTSLVGRCLTQSAEAQMANPSDSSNAGSVATIVTGVAKSAALALVPELTFGGSSLETIMHAIDGQLSYMMGILMGLSDLLASMDMAHCKMPDYFLNETVFCACGDTPFAIPESRRQEGIAGAGFWCTGVLSLLDPSNRPFVLYNPFTYAQLQSMASGTDAYLACVSSKLYDQATSDCEELLPSVPEFQGVSVLTVLTACKNNYMNSQWDKAAYMLFNETVFRQELGKAPPDLSIDSSITNPKVIGEISICLLDPATRPVCLQDYMSKMGYDPEVYWSYEDTIPFISPWNTESITNAQQQNERKSSSQYIDACQVFTGPAQNPDIGPDMQATFRACLDNYQDSNCQISSNLWTPQSDNAVPVAHRHGVKLGNTETLNSVIALKFQEAYDLVSEALKPLKDYNNPDLRTIFFSPEGDIMHQMMDCVFMGPYTKVNYWPQDLLGLLPVPSWHRDHDGTSRAVDPRVCVKESMDRSPPYSCGSHARQAVVKYFFRDYLPRKQNSTMNSIINSMTTDIMQAWGDISNYTCLCKDNITHSSTCCQTNSSDTWLPPNLSPSYQSLPSDAILRELTRQLKDFYRYALEDPQVWTKYLPAETLSSYNWSADPSSAEIASQQAHYRTDKPVVKYDSSEARSPLITTALWHQCHGILSQIFFTIPMSQGVGTWLPRNIPTEGIGGIESLDSFIQAAVREMFTTSPLYRHYNVSYVPSESRMCQKTSNVNQNTASWNTQIKLNSYSVSQTVLLNASGFPSQTAHGPNAFPMYGCICGWQISSGKCYPPQNVCASIPALCPFPVESISAMDLLKAHWSPTWECQSTVLSDQWGVLDANEMDDWLTGTKRDYTIQGYDLLKRGRAGLRVANFKNLTKQADMMSPFETRTIQPWQASLPNCISDFQSPLPDSVSQLKSMTRRLFPVSQGVFESGTTAYCLRYTVEAAFLAVLDMALALQSKLNPTSDSDSKLGSANAEQRMVSELWRTRCETQIALLSMCKGLDVFRPPMEFRNRIYTCPFSVSLSDNSDVYMTPGCLVHSGGVFYDPCNCPEFECGPSKPAFNHFVSSCRLSFDPRNMTGDNVQLGGWRVSPSEVFDSEGFIKSVLKAGEGLANVKRGDDWSKSEGTLKSTGRHCDMISDWWPDGETLPVGYHATTSCSSDETGYRTFDTAFAVERTAAPGQFTLVKMVYQNDLTRQASTIDTMAGGGGVCRSSNLGQPMIQTNRVRICTRIQSGEDTLDPAIQPGSPLYASLLMDSSFSSTEVCSEDSFETVWYDTTGVQDSALHSVGTVPNMPDTAPSTAQSPTPSTYPENLQRFMGLGPKTRVNNDIQAGNSGWGAGCSDFALKECTTDTNCPSDHFCLITSKICMHNDFKPEILKRCFRHDMCPFGLMCNGVGECVQGHITYLNNIQSPDQPSPIEAALFSEKCDEVNSNTYQTDGASPWEYVPDWLEGHGMCSNKNWYMYSLNLAGLQKSGCASACSSTSCKFNSRVCELSLNRSTWWPQLKAEPTAFAVKPTVCDRDYEHMNGPTGERMMGCTPKNTIIDNKIIDIDNTREEHISYAGLFRNFNSDGSTYLGLMPLRDVRRTGFLGLNESAVTLPNTLINCEKYQNCYAYTFTYNGIPLNGQIIYRQNGVDKLYVDNDIFKCGVAAYYDKIMSKCRLDTRSMHLYTALCVKQPTFSIPFNKCTCSSGAENDKDSIGCTPVVDRVRLESICSNIQTEYTANYETIQTNTKHLQDLFTVFIQDDSSLRSQVSGVECFEALHSSMQSAKYGQDTAMGLYYPFTFALYEVPLAWIYHCSYIGGIKITSTPTKISCQQYEYSKNVTEVRDGGVGFDFNFVRAGYRRSNVLNRIQMLSAAVKSAIPEVSSVPEFQEACKGIGVSSCSMVPYCASRRDWISNSLMSGITRKFLVGLYQPVYDCSTALRDSVLAEKQQTFMEFINNNTVLAGYLPDEFIKEGKLPEIKSLVADSLAACIDERYNIFSKWPFSVTFPSDSSGIQQCFRHSLGNVLNNLTLYLINIGHPYSNYDQAYMPSTDTSDHTFPRLSDAKASKACIYPDLRSQQEFFTPTHISDISGPFDKDQRFNGIECKKYPLTFMKGKQECKYPIQKQFTSLSSLLNKIWESISNKFITTLQSVPGITQLIDGTPPVELTFWQMTALKKNGFSTWSYDTTGIKSYMSNINPDTTKEVMCVISGERVNFTTCNDANFASLKDFTDSQRQDGAPIIPHDKQLTWKVSREFLSRGGIFAFANATREKKSVLLRNLFDDTTRCGIDEQMYNRVCLLSGQVVRPWVPWMSGEWNPYEMCDVRALDLDHGNLEEIWPYDSNVCKQCSDVNGQYRKEYMFDPTGCTTRSNTYSKFINVGGDAPTNLCSISMNDRDRTCTHAQGMVGGGRGQTVLNHPRMSHLYGTNNASNWPKQGGIFPRGNPVLTGLDSADDGYGFLSIPGDELGATGIGLSIESLPNGMPYLRVSHLPLLKQEGHMKRWKSDDVLLWAPGLQDAFMAEDSAHAAEQASRGNSAWDCPVRRAAYYGASILENSAVFAPAIPSPGRSRRLFGNVTGALSTHPTQSMQRGGSGIGSYVTSNGFCFCPSGMQSEQKQCLTPLSDTSHPCSLKKTIQALQGDWVQSHVFAPQSPSGGDSPCLMQFDWPYVSGTLRDGSNVTGDYTWASNPSSKKCHILDRLRPFQYRYKSDRQAVPVRGKFTTDQGGVCHTGRAATLTPQASAKVSTTRCVKQSETEDSMNVTCEDGSSITLAKEKSTPLDAMVEAVKTTRTKCSQCSPPPTFVNSKGVNIQPESSFGIPFRFSASRMAAADLRRLVCDGMGGEQNCSKVLRPAAWTANNFMQTLLTSPSDLFSGEPETSNTAPMQVASTWPDSDWVFCNTTEALKAGNCMGRIPEASWRKDRFQTCYKSIRDATRDSPEVMSSVDVCLIDSNLQDLCTAIDRAQVLVREANCLASGSPKCALKPFLYQPSAWDVSNREFVHSSVTHFYKRISPSTCPDHSSVIKENNQAMKSRCAATPVAAMYVALQACREIVDTLADVFFYAMNIVINGLRLVADMSGNRASIIAQTIYFWEQITHKLRNLLIVLSDMMFEMLFNMGTLGTRIYNFLKTSCGFFNTAYRYWLEVWCGIAIDLLPTALGAVRSTVELCETGFGVLNDSLDAIFTSIVPSALSMMQSRGYDKAFRDKKARDQAQQRQTISDSSKKSKKEGKKADFAQMAVVAAVTGGGFVAAEEIAKQIALTALSATKFGFLVDIGQGIADAIEMQRLMSLYPQNWTLFDFNSIYIALDVFEVYVSSDDRCLAYREANVTEILNCTFPSLSSKDSLAGASMVGTRCWADAQRDIGTSNLLACTESDTCYNSEYDRSTPIICGSCPIASSGYSTYGCSTVTKMCTCSVPTTQPTTCISNMECSYSTSTCQLITGLDDMSYGNQPCTDCTKDVQCIMRAGSGLGKCGCMFQSQALQKCTQMPGQFVPITDGNKLCGYLPNADWSSPLTAVQWDSLAMVKCIYLKAAHIFCTQAYRNGIAVPLAVGLSMASLTPSFQSRRLLVNGQMLPDGPFEVHNAESEYTIPETDEGHYLLLDDWNGTAEPCSSLVHAYQQASRAGQKVQLGPIDTQHLHSCAYWRLVGRRAVEQYNLTSLKGRDGFLLSVDDFASALAQRWVLVELISKPQVLIFVAGHSPLFKPLYAAMLTLRSMAISWGRQRIQEVYIKSNYKNPFTFNGVNFTWKSDIGSETESDFEHEFAFDSEEFGPLFDKSNEDKNATDSVIAKSKSENYPESTRFHGYTTENRHANRYSHENKPMTANDSSLGDHSTVNTPMSSRSNRAGSGRRLLQTQTDIKFAETWLAGPFTWPPPFFNRLNAQCNLATVVLQISHDLLSVLVTYYYGSFTSAPEPPRGIWDNLPNLTCSTSMKPAPPSNDMISFLYHSVWDLSGINPGYVREFFSNKGTTNIFTISTSMLKCDFQAVNYCSAHRKDLLASAVLIFILYVIIYYSASAMGVSFLAISIILAFGFTPLLLWYSYGMAFTCSPMLPTCLLDDLIYTLNSIFPLQVTFPSELQTSSDCLSDPSQESCLIRCSDPPVSFTEWRDTLAFGLCYTSQSMCLSLAEVIGERDSISAKLTANANILLHASISRINAHIFCFGVTFVNIIPVLLLLAVGATVAGYILYLPCAFIPKLVALIGQYMVYLHTKSHDD